MFAMFRKPKTFKLRALHSHKKFGVAGKSCQEVLRKGCRHLQVALGPGVGGPDWGLRAATCRSRGGGRGRRGEHAQGLWVGWDSAKLSSFTISPGGACVSSSPDRCVPRTAGTVHVSPKAENLSRTAVAPLPVPGPPAGTSRSLTWRVGVHDKPCESGANALVSQTWPGGRASGVGGCCKVGGI